MSNAGRPWRKVPTRKTTVHFPVPSKDVIDAIRDGESIGDFVHRRLHDNDKEYRLKFEEMKDNDRTTTDTVRANAHQANKSEESSHDDQSSTPQDDH